MSRHRQMQIFAALAQAGSLAAAARVLGLAPVTVTRAVAALEARLGAPLLLRSPRGVRLSEAGERFADRCRLILEHVSDAERSAAGLHHHPAGRLTVSLPLLMLQQIFTPLAIDYLDSFPQVRLVVQGRESLPRLLEEGIDVALVTGLLPDSAQFAVPVGSARPMLCASPGYLNRWGRPLVAEDLRHHRTLLATAQRLGCECPILLAVSRGRQPPVLSCSTRQGAIEAAMCGLGLVSCLGYEVYRQLQGGQLETVLDTLGAPPIPVQMIYREGRQACARVRTFIDFMVPRLRGHPALR